MTILRPVLYQALLLLTAVALTGCGGSASPPPGATKRVSAPEVDLGSATEDKQASDAEATEESTEEASAEETTGTAEEGGWATLTGRIVYDGNPPETKPIEPTKDVEVCGKHEIPDEELIVSSDGGIQNAVIMLRTKDVEVAPSYADAAAEKVVVDNKNCRFEPHVSVVMTGQEVALSNSDPVGHNSKIDPILNPGINPILPAGGEPVVYKFEAAEAVPVPVGCNIHPWMKAYLVVRQDPYAAVSDADGKFVIKDLPAGKELEFGLWQENSGYLKNASYNGGKANNRGRFKIKLKPGENDLGDITVSSSVFNK